MTKKTADMIESYVSVNLGSSHLRDRRYADAYNAMAEHIEELEEKAGLYDAIAAAMDHITSQIKP